MPIVAFLCHFYGGVPRQWLKLPVRQFFAMYREGVRIEARQYSELADVVLIADNMQISYYESVKKRYARLIDPEKPALPEKPSVVIEAGSADAEALFRGVGRGLRSNFGYG
jgi:hypothetical protein